VNLCGETEEVICGGAATRDRALLEPVESGHDAGSSAPLTALQLRHILTHTSADSPIAQLWHERCLAAQTSTAWRSRLWRGEHVDAREAGAPDAPGEDCDDEQAHDAASAMDAISPGGR
jgi:hypothetical protein